MSTTVPASMDAVNEEATLQSEAYIPAVDFEEDEDVPCSEFSPADSREVWLIQEPLHQLTRDDFEGKEVSLKIDGDGLGKLTSSKGKSFKLVTSTSEGIDAAGFMQVASNSIGGVKISRHVCLIHYPDASDLEKPKTHLTSSSHRSGGSEGSSMRSRSWTPSKNKVAESGNRTSHDTLTSTLTMGHSVESTKHSSQKRARDSSSSMQTGMSSGCHSQIYLPESHLTGNSFGSPDALQGQSPKKRKKSKQ